MNSKLIQIKDAAQILGVSKLTLRNWDKQGKLTAFRHPINNYRVYRSEDVHDIIKKIESGERPLRHTYKKLSTDKTEKDSQKSKIYNLKVIHLKD
jgi:excisionase family DNA binding protein